MKVRISIIICTLNREEVFCQTLQRVVALMQHRSDAELIVVDQTRQHKDETECCLNALAKDIRWERVDFASLTRARNHGVRLACGEIILFLDDDVEPSPQLIDEHLACYARPEIWGVGGCTLLPGKRKLSRDDLTFSELQNILSGRISRFDLDWSYATTWAPGCNMSFRREKLLLTGGFDESFYGMAVGEETELCFRIRKAGGVIQYSAAAELIHLVNPNGGCRDAQAEEERTAQMLDNIYYMLRRVSASRIKTWEILVRQFLTIVLNRKAIREWTWPQLGKNYLVGLHRAFSGRNRQPRLPFSR